MGVPEGTTGASPRNPQCIANQRVLICCDDEIDLNMFYYLADNAISWPQNMTLTKRCLFLYHLAKFFKYIPDNEYDKNKSISTSKEIADKIKYTLKQMKAKDKDGEILAAQLNSI